MGTNSETDSLIEYIYIHIPFCLKKCDYCSFFSVKYERDIKEKYLSALLKEIELYRKIFLIKPGTVYFGGGTPSLLTSQELNEILAKFEIAEKCEITLEANPKNITAEFAEKISATPINRISLGAQSFLDNELKLLGRLHDAKQIFTAYHLLKNAGFDNISLDLIYGLPQQKLRDVEFSLNEMLALNPQHISTYCLGLEEHVPLYRKKSQIPSDETVSGFYYFIREKLLSAGFEQYEISNFAKTGFASKHNLSYWNDKSYLGFGAAAAGYLKTGQTKGNRKLYRYSNPADLEKYFQMIENDEISKNWQILKSAEHEEEFIFLSLRTTKGLNLTKYRKEFGTEFIRKHKKKIAKYLNDGFLEIDKNFIRLNPKAYFVSNEIFAEFI